MYKHFGHISLVFANLVFIICRLITAEGYSEEKLSVRRFLHGCPFAFPCPPPPCENPVFGPRNCCGSCPEPETAIPETTATTTTSTLKKKSLGFKRSFLKLKPASYLREVFKRSDASETGFDRRQAWTRTTYPTTTYCPYPCTHHGYHYCHPLPCHIVCVDAVKPPGACCYECQNGPNCSHEGQVIPEGQNYTLPSGDVAFCSNGGIDGGSVYVYKVFG